MLVYNRKPDWEERLPDEFLDILRPLDSVITYNSLIEEAIIKQSERLLSAEEKENLGLWVYIGRKNLREDRKAEYRQKMLGDGWSVLDHDIFDKAIREGKRLELCAVVTCDWLSNTVTDICKPIICPDGRRFLVKPKCRKRGWYLTSLTMSGRDAFCKLVS